MRLKFRGAVTLALCLLANHATLLAQYPIADGQVVYPSSGIVSQPCPTGTCPTPSIAAPQSIAQPTPAPQPAKPVAQPVQQPAPAAKPLQSDAEFKAWMRATMTQAIRDEMKSQPVAIEPPKPADPPKPKYVEQSTRTMPAPPGITPIPVDRTSFESSAEEAKAEYQTNGIDVSKIPQGVRITHGGQDLSAQQFAAELRDHYGAGPFDNDKQKYWVGVFGDQFEQQVADLMANDADWKYIAERCIVDFRSANNNPALAWRWKSIDCDRPGGIIVCAPGYDRSNPNDACVAIHAQEDTVSFKEVIGSAPPPAVMAQVEQSQVEGPRRRNGNDEALKFSRVPNIRVKVGWLLSIMLYFVSNKEAAAILATIAGWVISLALAALAIYAGFKLVGPIRDWMRNRQAERANRAAKESLEIERLKAELEAAKQTPATTPVVEPQTPLCPTPVEPAKQPDPAMMSMLEKINTQMADMATQFDKRLDILEQDIVHVVDDETEVEEDDRPVVVKAKPKAAAKRKSPARRTARR